MERVPQGTTQLHQSLCPGPPAPRKDPRACLSPLGQTALTFHLSLGTLRLNQYSPEPTAWPGRVPDPRVLEDSQASPSTLSQLTGCPGPSPPWPASLGRALLRPSSEFLKHAFPTGHQAQFPSAIPVSAQPQHPEPQLGLEPGPSTYPHTCRCISN